METIPKSIDLSKKYSKSFERQMKIANFTKIKNIATIEEDITKKQHMLF